MVENLIAGYLATGKRLVIPDLGAFLKKETGETVFVEFLKKDDGVFAGLISQSLGIPAADAARQAAEFSAGVRESLAGRGFFIVPRVGTLRRDATGTLNLTPLPAGDTPIPAKPAPEPALQATPRVSSGAASGQASQPKVVPYTPPRQQARVEQYTPPARSTAQAEGQTPGPGSAKTEGQPPGTPPPTAPVAGQAEAPPVRPDMPTQRPTSPTAAPRRPEVVPPPAATTCSGVTPATDRSAATPPPAQQRSVASGPIPERIAQERSDPEQRRPQRPPVQVPQRRRKTDMVMIIAVVAALIAIGSMVFGLLVNNDPIVNIQPTSPRQEQVVTDTEPAAEGDTEQGEE